MDIFTQGLETERMYLVPLEEKYAEDYFRELNAEITKYMTPSPAKDISETKARMQGTIQKMQRKEKIALVYINKTTSEFIGGLNISGLGNPTLKVGLWTKKSVHGQGFGREGMLALIERVQKNLDFEYILYPADKDNRPSRKIAELAGGILEVDKKGEEIVIREATADPEKFLNAVEYKIYKRNA
ncbi:MAG: GNAT family N-acetyltransferase [Candidatus Peribacteria bacterium]|jgi:RimJ/RimL family protein N-acetyltransferase|nr:GNAT family N-acetyltransferase [Candidatus Peribacteria bacterium]